METVTEFCKRVGISRRLFDLRCAQGDAPRFTRIGTKRLISAGASAEWLKAHEDPPVEQERAA